MSTRITEALQEALKLCSLAETMTACRGDDDFIAGVRAKIEAALSTEPGEAALHYECASAGCERPATVHFIRADVGSYYCRECYMRVQAIPAAPLTEDTRHG